MKAPLSKKIVKALEDKISSQNLVKSVIVTDAPDSSQVELNGKVYNLQRIESFYRS